MREKDCEECDGRGWVHGDAGGGNVRRVECVVCKGRGRVPADEIDMKEAADEQAG